MKFILRIVINAAALWVAARLVPGIEAGGVGSILAIAVVFGVLNALDQAVPEARLLPGHPPDARPLHARHERADADADRVARAGKLGIDFRVDGFWAAFLGALLVSIVSTVLSWFLPDGE